MKIFLLLNQPYPNGYALTKRFHLYARGLIKLGHDVKIIIPHPYETGQNIINSSTFGVFEEVPFNYTWKDIKRSNNFLKRRYHDFAGFFRTGLDCAKERPDIVISASFPIYFFMYLRFLSLLFPFQVIREINEVVNMRAESITLVQKIKSKFFYKFYHGLIVVSEELSGYLTEKLKIIKKRIIVPILIQDFKRNKELAVQKTIVYTGTYLERKDGIITLLKAFSEIKHKYPDYKMILTGAPDRSQDYEKIRKTIATYDLDSHIHFTGYISEQKLHEILISAGMLVLAKPENRQNLYNFPTKVGEYLISGRPILATKVGPAGKLLNDGENIFYSEFEVKEIARLMEFLINNPEIACQVGNQGRLFALENFDFRIHTKRMADFFKRFIS